MTDFSRLLLEWFDAHGRKDLPWQHPRTPYRVWVSEIMLQQTQVATVIGYFNRFVNRFPDIASLAQAPLDDVLHHWSGLGYYARARNLHKAADLVRIRHNGEMPDTHEALVALPGIGASTANAILSMAFNQPAAILDGNVKRVLCRLHGVTADPQASRTVRLLWEHARSHVDTPRPADYTQAIMDFGATHCVRRNPDCAACPVQHHCVAFRLDQVADIPAARKTKAKPHRNVRWILLQAPDGACLLQRRPATGVWGGLWAPPEQALEESTASLLRQLGYHADRDITVTRDIAPFEHQFTHFSLTLYPQVLRVRRASDHVADDADLTWWHPGDGRALGFPAPAVTLLNALYTEGEAQER